MTRIFRIAVLALLSFSIAACGDEDGTSGAPDSGGTDVDYPYDLDGGLRCDGGIDIPQPSPDGVGTIPTGVERCPDGSMHRYATVPCTSELLEEYMLCGDDDFDCSTCAEGELCVGSPGGPDQYCSCITPCANDGDCADGQACLCAEVSGYVSMCKPASCRADVDCGGYECGVGVDCCDSGHLMCHSTDDTCHGDAQCEDGEVCLPQIGVGPVDAWGCEWDCDCE